MTKLIKSSEALAERKRFLLIRNLVIIAIVIVILLFLVIVGKYAEITGYISYSLDVVKNYTPAKALDASYTMPLNNLIFKFINYEKLILLVNMTQ